MLPHPAQQIAFEEHVDAVEVAAGSDAGNAAHLGPYFAKRFGTGGLGIVKSALPRRPMPAVIINLSFPLVLGGFCR